MKKIILLFVLSFSTLSAQATQMCYDMPVGVVDSFITKLKSCDENLDVSKFEELRDTLMVDFFRATRILSVMQDAYIEMYSVLPYGDKTEEVKACLSKLQYKAFDEVKMAVMDGIIQCR